MRRRHRTRWVGREVPLRDRVHESALEMSDRLPDRDIDERATAFDAPVKLRGNVARLRLEESGVCRPRLTNWSSSPGSALNRLMSTTGETSVSICCISVTSACISVSLGIVGIVSVSGLRIVRLPARVERRGCSSASQTVRPRLLLDRDELCEACCTCLSTTERDGERCRSCQGRGRPHMVPSCPTGDKLRPSGRAVGAVCLDSRQRFVSRHIEYDRH